MDEKKLRVLWLRYLTEIRDHSAEVSAEILEDKNICEAVERSCRARLPRPTGYRLRPTSLTA